MPQGMTNEELRDVIDSPDEAVDADPAEYSTLHPDPSGMLPRAEASGSFADQMADFLKQPGMGEAVEAARQGSAIVLRRDQNTGLLCLIHSRDSTSWIVQCLPDDLNAVPDPGVRYIIAYGAGGARRTSGLLLPGMWICHGTDVQVVGISSALGGNQARFAAFVTRAPGALPNIP